MDDQQQRDASETALGEAAPAGDPLPDVDELRAVTEELDDVELVLNNLERDTQALDATCQVEADSGALTGRPALDLYRSARIASETAGSPPPTS